MDNPIRVNKKRKNSGDSDSTSFKMRKKGPEKKPKILGEEERHEEARLEKLVFGEASFLSRNEFLHLDSKDMEELDSGLEEDELETAGGEVEGVMDTVMASEKSNRRLSESKKKLQPAWQDEEDLSKRFRTAAVGSGSSPSRPPTRRHCGLVDTNLMWARLNRNTRGRSTHHEGTSDSEDSDDEQSGDSDDGDILRHCGDLFQRRRTVASVQLGTRDGAIPGGSIHFKKVHSLNNETYVEGPLISDVRFHPTSSVAAVAGISGIASIFQVDGRNNSKLASVQFERYPVHCARFSTDGSELLVGSKSHPHFFSYDLLEGRTTKMLTNQCLEQTNTKNFEMSPCGRFIALAGRWGAAHILTSRAKEWVTTFHMTGDISSMCFSPDGSQLFTFGESGEVWVWDMGSRVCIHRFADEGSFGGSSLAVSPSGRFIACGCQTGLVNLYDRDEAFKSAAGGCARPSPIYTISNLVTSITTLRFDPTSELLVMASADKADAIKMVHLPSRSVYCNFPGRNPKISRPLCVDISPHGGYLTIGNSKGTALLYRLDHFGNY